MNKTCLRKGRSWMPSYNKIILPVYSDLGEGAKLIGKFYAESKPLGFRGIKFLSSLLHFFPYITGGKPRFIWTVKQLEHDSHYGSYDAILYRLHANNSEVVAVHNDSPFEDDMLCDTGHYSYKVTVIMSKTKSIEPVKPCSSEGEIVTFKVLAQEDITIVVLSVFVGFIISLLTWLITKGY